jgi:hypothetical protein
MPQRAMMGVTPMPGMAVSAEHKQQVYPTIRLVIVTVSPGKTRIYQ